MNTPTIPKCGSSSAISYVGSGPKGPHVIYLREGKRITVGRDKSSKGPTWLVIEETPIVRAQATTANGPTGTEAKVCADIASRQAIGIAKYGVTVESNPLPLRAWLQHAYEECLDKAIYLRRAIDELEKTEIR